MASAVSEGWAGGLDAALAGYGRVRDQCSIPLSDANLGVARLDMAAEALGAAWLQMSLTEQALHDQGCAGTLTTSAGEPVVVSADRVLPAR